MSVLIAIPIYRIACRVGIAKGRAWSVVEEMVLWSMTRQSKSVSALVSETGLQRQIVLAAITRLMRFRLVEVNIAENGATFRQRLRIQGGQQRQSAPRLPKKVQEARQLRD